ncbi:MAG TPA: S9 family peptidase [Verrucomicrobiae bacterium]
MWFKHLAVWSAMVASVAGQTPGVDLPPNLVAEGIPPIPAEVRESASRYLDFRAAAFQSWHPKLRSMLITTRFGEAPQIHEVATAGGARRQLTFLPEPVASASYQPKEGKYLVFSQDKGGGEFFQFYRFEPADGRVTLLTDGKSRNTGARWSTGGTWLAYSSTRRNGRDTDIWMMDPAQPNSDRLLVELSGGGWSVADWSEDDQQLAVLEYVSINESYIWIVDVKSGDRNRITVKTKEKVAYNGALFSRDGNHIYTASDLGSEFTRLGRVEIKNGKFTPLVRDLNWDVTSFDLSPDGKTLAFVTNEDGVSILRIADARTGKIRVTSDMPKGVIGGLEWHEDSRHVGFSFSSARSSGDAYSLDVRKRKIERWTFSETSGLNPATFVEPELVKMKSFDGVQISAFVYRPDPKKFPGKRPVLLQIHGGPESQFRPSFGARNNYFINEMGIAIVVPNVRGSAGYGKTFLALDNGMKREDSVKDIGTVLDFIGKDPVLDKDRVVVIGGSYGGYMVLASMIHFADRIRAGIDIVGISNFLTFLKNTQDYRRDLRRVEYGDERNPEMHAFLDRISPSNNAKKIQDPLFVVQGKNDPRVPVTESEQMVKAVRENGRDVWYLMAEDEGHGFAKKRNQDIQFLCTIMFLQKFAL